MSKSPFPGMDPFIEARSLWRDFHDKLIGDLERTLSRLLPRRYAVRLDERTYIEWHNPDEDRRTLRVMEPDVRVQEVSAARRSSAAVTLEAEPLPAEAPVTMHSMVEVEEREIFLEVRDLERNKGLVTCIEVLSPTNKRLGSEGWKAYSFKRDWLLKGGANFVELDLLRDGQRRRMREPWPESPYYILVSRRDAVPQCAVWPAFSTAPLPPVHVPLANGDPDVVVDLQPLVDDVYERSRYYEDLQYDQPHDIALRHEEALLLDQFTGRHKA